jgi:hypothetical protein
MIPVLVMQPTLNEVIDMIAVRHGFMTARWTVFMSRLMACMLIVWRALGRIRVAHLDHVLVDVIAMRMVHVPVMQVVDMIAMADRGVPTVRTVLMRVIGVLRLRAVRHGRSPLTTFSHGA